jgi:hypothetical protein
MDVRIHRRWSSVRTRDSSVRTWREVERRALDGASRSLKREFEEVIMVEVLIGEMFRSDRSRSKDYKRAVVVDAGEKRKRQRTKEKTSFR